MDERKVGFDRNVLQQSVKSSSQFDTD